MVQTSTAICAMRLQRTKGGCRGSTELGIVAPRPSWREIFLWKTQLEKKGGRK